mmetsp:Transcript_15015/g.37784  ORF Transcript_15015/g.37784 Transcript_15015/m.37784 type:complete len:228 (+) Transcript_15015:422-1105(+)
MLQSPREQGSHLRQTMPLPVTHVRLAWRARSPAAPKAPPTQRQQPAAPAPAVAAAAAAPQRRPIAAERPRRSSASLPTPTHALPSPPARLPGAPSSFAEEAHLHSPPAHSRLLPRPPRPASVASSPPLAHTWIHRASRRMRSRPQERRQRLHRFQHQARLLPPSCATALSALHTSARARCSCSSFPPRQTRSPPSPPSSRSCSQASPSRSRPTPFRHRQDERSPPRC